MGEEDGEGRLEGVALSAKGEPLQGPKESNA